MEEMWPNGLRSGNMTTESLWDSLGLDPLAQQAFAFLLEHPNSTAGVISTGVGQDTITVHKALDRLIDTRLAVSQHGSYEATDPRTSISALARRRQSALDQAHSVAITLAEIFSSVRQPAVSDDPRLRVLRAENVGRLLVESLEQASTSIDAVVTQPVAGSDASDNVEFDALRRGVAIRSILHPTVFTDPRLDENITTAQTLGEQIRISPGVATKLLIIDSRTVIFPIAEGPNKDVRAIVSELPTLTQTIQNLFEIAWSSAKPIPTPSLSRQTRPKVNLGEMQLRDVLELLTLGLNDTNIMRRLQISDRTLRRRIQELLDLHQCSSRFQLGMAIAAIKDAS